MLMLGLCAYMLDIVPMVMLCSDLYVLSFVSFLFLLYVDVRVMCLHA